MASRNGESFVEWLGDSSFCLLNCLDTTHVCLIGSYSLIDFLLSSINLIDRVYLQVEDGPYENDHFPASISVNSNPPMETSVIIDSLTYAWKSTILCSRDQPWIIPLSQSWCGMRWPIIVQFENLLIKISMRLNAVIVSNNEIMTTKKSLPEKRFRLLLPTIELKQKNVCKVRWVLGEPKCLCSGTLDIATLAILAFYRRCSEK